MFQEKFDFFLLRFSGALLVFMLLLSACNAPIFVSTDHQSEKEVAQNTPADAPVEPDNTPTPAQEEKPEQGLSVTIDLNGVAQDYTSQVIEAVPASAGGPYWEVMPQYTLLTLSDYTISNHSTKPQIFIYPLNDLAAVNEGAGKMAANLQALLQNHQEGEKLPFLPLVNTSQMMHARLEYRDFKNGKGLRYLTQYGQAAVPVNNNALFYTYQGLTSDGQYYVAAVLPVNLASLPADENLNGQEPSEFNSNFSGYLKDMVNTLNQQPANAFTPDLDKLDAMLQSIEIK